MKVAADCERALALTSSSAGISQDCSICHDIPMIRCGGVAYSIVFTGVRIAKRFSISRLSTSLPHFQQQWPLTKETAHVDTEAISVDSTADESHGLQLERRHIGCDNPTANRCDKT